VDKENEEQKLKKRFGIWEKFEGRESNSYLRPCGNERVGYLKIKNFQSFKFLKHGIWEKFEWI